MTIGNLATLSRFLVDADSTSYSDANLLINLNNSYEKIIGNLIGENYALMFGDSRYTSLPTGYADLVDGTQSYRLTTIDSDWLTIHSVKILDSDGNYQELKQIDLKDIEAFETYQSTNGQPNEYTIREGFVLLFPAPATANVTLTNGLQIVFERTANVFTSGELTTGTAIPGFASPYHELMAYDAAIPYAIKYKPERVAFLQGKANEIERNLMDFYANFNKDSTKNKKLTMRKINHR